MTMIRRNGSAPKVIGGLFLFFGLVYLIYIYNDVSGQLKDTEHTAERYRRESENVAAQLQDLTIAKGELKQKCETDRQEFTNRLNALQQQHKMLKSQHEDMQSEYHRLQKQHEQEADDHKQIDEQRNQEYNQFKQEKVLEVSNLKDQVANYEREKVQLTEEIAELKKKLQESFAQINTDQQTIANLQQQLINHKNQVSLDQRVVSSLQEQLYNMKNAVAQQQGNMAMQGGAQQGGNVQQGLQQGQNLLQQLQGNQQFIQPAVNQGGLFHQNQPIYEQQQGQQQQGNLGQQQGQLGQQQGQIGQQQGQLGQQQGQIGQQQGQIGQQQGHLGHLQGQQAGVAGENPFNQFNAHQPLVQGNWMGQQQDSQDVQKDSKQEAERVMKEQEQHQIKPPGDKNLHEEEGLGHQKLGQEMIGLEAIKDKDLHGGEEQKQIAKPNFNPQIPHPDDGVVDSDNQEGAADGAGGNHDNRIENQGPVNLQVQEPVFKDHAEAQKPIADDNANLKFRPIMPEDVVQQVVPQDHDDSIKKEQIDHPLGDRQEIKGHNIDENKNEEKNLGPLEEDDDKGDGAIGGDAQGRV